MATRHLTLAKSRHAISCAVLVLLSACGGGGGGSAGSGSSPVATLPPGTDVVSQPVATNTTPVAVPAPADLSVAPPPAADTAQPASPATSAAVAAADPAPSATVATSDASSIVLGTPVITDLPAGATPCQPSICPAFDSNGSVTNSQGNANPTAAHAYVIASSQAPSGSYPDLGNLPTLIMPLVPVKVGEVAM